MKFGGCEVHWGRSQIHAIGKESRVNHCELLLGWDLSSVTRVVFGLTPGASYGGWGAEEEVSTLAVAIATIGAQREESSTLLLRALQTLMIMSHWQKELAPLSKVITLGFFGVRVFPMRLRIEWPSGFFGYNIGVFLELLGLACPTNFDLSSPMRLAGKSPLTRGSLSHLLGLPQRER